MVRLLLLMLCCCGQVRNSIGQPGPCDSITWSADRQLTWSDFKAPPDTTSRIGALSFISFGYQLVEENDRQYLTVVNYFEPCRSWFRPGDSTLSLHHEQIHFNIDEFIRRMFIKEVKGLKTISRFAFPGVRDVYFSAMRYRNFLHRRFDIETNYHRDTLQEEHWRTTILKMLTGLEGYSKSVYTFNKPYAPMQRLSTAQQSNYTVP